MTSSYDMNSINSIESYKHFVSSREAPGEHPSVTYCYKVDSSIGTICEYFPRSEIYNQLELTTTLFSAIIFSLFATYIFGKSLYK